MPLEVELYEDAVEFAAAGVPWMETHEAENALLLGLLLDRLQAPVVQSPLLARVTVDGSVALAAYHSGVNFILTRGPEDAVDALVETLSVRSLALPAVVGPAAVAERFARGWAKVLGCEARLWADQRIHQLTELLPQTERPVAGNWRVLQPADLELVARWAFDFDREALPGDPHSLEAARERVRPRIDQGNFFAWINDGEPVSMAALVRPTRNTISVNAVYTPPEHRNRGYATALVSAVSEQGFGRGKRACVLYTDLANPTSNSIYRKLGYRPVCDSRTYRFRPF